MNEPTACPYHATVAGHPSDTIGNLDMQRSWIPPESSPAHASWSQWQHAATFTGDAYGHQWATTPLQPVVEEQWPTAAPVYQGEGHDPTGAMWSHLSGGFSFQQQQRQLHQQQAPGYCDSNDYDAEDAWAPAMPPTPQLTPTWHLAHMVPGQTHPVPQASEAQEKGISVSPVSEVQKQHQAHSQPRRNDQTRRRHTSQFACPDIMATPPGESESDIVEICTSGKKRPRPEEPTATAPVSERKYRVKNRAAAKRCRDKSRQFETDLAAREKQLSVNHVLLEASVAALREEILTLKHRILQHGDCDCEVIQTYISRVANQVSNPSACQQGPRR
ncbi:hypothetical protein F5X68DRAFT_226610 [Plectosphaerella plurivora]|uniref:BZIP domain-containing protein n=1 Tax=Plectosphaerella plurivora TaxID=936078 RepID=A0A9P8VN40_9PEZI|nr:hypothetical protein F5X68DRAFT_226610 [Plectosphaerella plurivora]